MQIKCKNNYQKYLFACTKQGVCKLGSLTFYLRNAELSIAVFANIL